MANEDPITRLSALASHTFCPSCKHGELEFTLRCDLSYGACLYTVHCSRCNTSFEVVEAETELELDEVRRAAGPCPRCGSGDRTASLECSEKTRSCIYHVKCNSCGTDL